MQATAYHPEIARTIPPDATERIGNILLKTARLLGWFEAYTAIAKKFRTLEAPLETDELTVNILVDLCKRTSGVLENGENIENHGNLEGFRDVLDQRVFSISQIRNEACAVIAEVWNIEEQHPGLKLVPTDEFDENSDEFDENSDHVSVFRDNLNDDPNTEQQVGTEEDSFDMYM